MKGTAPEPVNSGTGVTVTASGGPKGDPESDPDGDPESDPESDLESDAESDAESDPEGDPGPALEEVVHELLVGFVHYMFTRTMLLLLMTVLVTFYAAAIRHVVWFFTEFLGEFLRDVIDVLWFEDGDEQRGLISFGTRWDLEPSPPSSSPQERLPGGFE